jgi:hypothetical protein
MFVYPILTALRVVRGGGQHCERLLNSPASLYAACRVTVFSSFGISQNRLGALMNQFGFLGLALFSAAVPRERPEDKILERGESA